MNKTIGLMARIAIPLGLALLGGLAGVRRCRGR